MSQERGRFRAPTRGGPALPDKTQASDCVLNPAGGNRFFRRRRQNLGVEAPNGCLVFPPRDTWINFFLRPKTSYRSPGRVHGHRRASRGHFCGGWMEIHMDTIKIEWGRWLKVTVQGRRAIYASLLMVLLCIGVSSEEIRSQGRAILYMIGKSISEQGHNKDTLDVLCATSVTLSPETRKPRQGGACCVIIGRCPTALNLGGCRL